MEGRFVSKDPIGFGGGDVNLYGYVFNAPVKFIDPTGFVCGSGVTEWLVPDKTYWTNPDIDFTAACQNHDDCYGTPHSNKDTCDDNLYKDMMKECEGLVGVKGNHCRALAGTYHSAVNNLGSGAYRSAQEKVCIEIDYPIVLGP
jgi:hypothetical protein